MTKLAFFCTLVLAAACGPKSSGSTADPCKDPCKDKPMEETAMTCATMGDQIAAGMKGQGEMGEVDSSKMSGVFASECSSMGWSQEIIDCLGAASDPDAAEACVSSMSDEQRESLDRAMEGLEGE